MKMGQLYGSDLFDRNKKSKKPKKDNVKKFLAGGSDKKFVFQGEILIKKCKCYEVEAFEAVYKTFEFLTNILDFQKLPAKYESELKHLNFYRGLRPFVAQYQGY